MKKPTVPPLLARRFEPLMDAERTVRGYKFLAVMCLVAAAALAAWWLLPHPAWTGARRVLVPLGAYASFVLATAGGWWWLSRRPVDALKLARRIEEEHPELQATLLTALEEPGAEGLSRYLHERVVKDAVRHGISHDWMGNRRRRQVVWWKTLGLLSLLALVAVQVLMLVPKARPVSIAKAAPAAPVTPPPVKLEVEVRPGDVEIERGTRLVVEARFKGGAPEGASIVLSADESGQQEWQRVPMKAGVEASAFGGVVTKVDKDGFYRVVYGTQSSPTYRITTYVHPELVQADAVITPPAYSGQPVKEIKKTQNVTALEGSQVKFRIKVNKPVAEAELYGEDKQSVPLVASKDDPLMLEGTMTPEQTQKYRLHLVDAQERANKQPPWFKVNILSDQPPKVEIVFPKRDLAVSPIQEMPLEAKVWDDLGVSRAGAVFMLGDQTREVMLSGEKLEGKKHHDLKTMMEMEALKAEPRQLLSYYVWAEDAAPGGQVRRTQSDMFFAEVRHFEDIFREGEAPPGGEPGAGGGSPATKLAKLQKEVLNATWKVAREAGAGRKFDQLATDMGVLHESQEIARQQAEEAAGEAEDAEVKAALEDAQKEMAQAVKTLQEGVGKKNLQANNDALVPERRALEALYRAQSREHRVMRNQQSQSSSASSQSEERQLMQLELKQQDKRYEEEKAAGEEKTAEQQENLQVLARLKELARRQEALAEKIKELENQLQQAKTEEQKQELEQQLKRLQEEQEQLLKDLDDLKERMEKPENQATMAQEKEKLDQAREQVREAAEQLAQQQTGSAASAATKAQENLEKVRDEFRERTARRFAEEMKQLKQDAAALAGQQEKLAEQMTAQAQPPQQGKGKAKDQVGELQERLQATQVSREAEAQREALEKLMEQMRQLSEQAEPSEPLLSNALHDAMRRAHAAGINDALAEARDQMQYGRTADAQAQERKAAKGIDDLKQSVDKAAESVLGSETESLRMARAELDKLLEEASRDVKPGEGAQPGKTGAAGEPPNGEPKSTQAQAAGAEGQKEGKEGATPGAQEGAEEGQGPGKGQEPGKEPQMAQAGQDGKPPGEGKQPGETPGQGQGQGQGREQAQNGQQPGEQPGQGQGEGQGRQPGQQPGQGQGQSPGQGQQGGQPSQGQGQSQMAGTQGQQGQGQSPSQAQASAQGQGQGQGQPGGRGDSSNPQAGQRPGQPGQVAQGGDRTARGGGGGGGGGESSPGDAGGGGGDWFFDQPEELANDSAITGANYEGWADRLRRVEEALSSQELREQAARVQDNARNLRVDSRRNDLPPQSDQVRMQIIQPLAELRDRVKEELARKEAANPLAPLDRDPVPHRFREQVRRYYTELGGGN